MEIAMELILILFEVWKNKKLHQTFQTWKCHIQDIYQNVIEIASS